VSEPVFVQARAERAARMTRAPDGEYLDAAIETMPRAGLRAVQERKLRAALPFMFERSALVRATWAEAGLHPSTIGSLDQFFELAPFMSKDSIRRFRDRSQDPYDGLLCCAPGDLYSVQSTSGTTGDPTLLPFAGRDSYRDAVWGRWLWQMGARPGDYCALVSFTFRGPKYLFPQAVGAVPVLFDHGPEELERLCRVSRELRPTTLYMLSNPLILALRELERASAVDLQDVFSSYRGTIYAGEPLSPASRDLVASWGLELFNSTALGDLGSATECRVHNGLHFWEDRTIVEHLEPDGTGPAPPGEVGELVVTSLDPTMPLMRYRSDDLVRITWDRCDCGRTHGRLTPVGRKSDGVVVRGRRIVPLDVWAAVEAVPETSAALFQLVRSPGSNSVLVIRVGCDARGQRSADEIRSAVAAEIDARAGVPAQVELVPNAEILALGPPHKIPRVTNR
jgi:phenylacetate-CoA ligase